jgi:hypothetical protein
MAYADWLQVRVWNTEQQQPVKIYCSVLRAKLTGQLAPLSESQFNPAFRRWPSAVESLGESRRVV